MGKGRRSAALAAVGLLAGVTAVHAQARAPRVTLEAQGGVLTFGRFVEQRLPASPLERELTGSTSLALGGSVGFRLWEKTGLRLGFTWSGSELEFEDDSGRGSVDEPLAEDLADLDAFVTSASLLRYLLDERRRVSPYGVAGVTAVWWSLGERDGGPNLIQASGDDTEFRLGTIGGVGLQIRVSGGLGVRLEASRISSRNPFDGDDAFRVASGETFDEPDDVSTNRLTLAVTYGFGR